MNSLVSQSATASRRFGSMSRLVLLIVVAFGFVATLTPSIGQAQSISGSTGSYVYPSQSCRYGSIYSGTWYQPAVLGAPLQQYDCSFDTYVFTGPANYTGPITFTLSNSYWGLYKNVASPGLGSIGVMGGWVPPTITGACEVPTTTTSSAPATGGAYFINGQLTINSTQYTKYCIIVAMAVQAAGGMPAVNINYTLSWAPNPAFASSPVTDGPIPLWAYGLLGLVMFLIARRQMFSTRARS